MFWPVALLQFMTHAEEVHLQAQYCLRHVFVQDRTGAGGTWAVQIYRAHERHGGLSKDKRREPERGTLLLEY